MFPGQKLQLSLKGLDQFNLSTYIIARISDSRANINQGAFSQSTDSELLANNKNVSHYKKHILLCVIFLNLWYRREEMML